MAQTVLVSESESVSRFGWKIHLFGPFRVFDPLGNSVSFQTRKVEGLLAILAVHRKYGLPRDELAAILWPDRGLDSQRASLRQALASLRRSIGVEAVESSRSYCSLSIVFQFQSDFDRPEWRDGGLFMPNQDGDWFEHKRTSIDPDSSPYPAATVVGNLLGTLKWLSANDPRSMFELLKASSPIARGIPYSEMLTLLSESKKLPSLAGWAAYWRGVSETDLEVCMKLLRFALGEAKKQDDPLLASEICLELGKVYSRTGNYQRSQEVAKVAEAIAAKSGTVLSKLNASRLNGTLSLHWSNSLQGVEQLQRAEDLCDSTIDQAVARSIRAFYLVATKRLDEGQEVLEWPLRIAENLGHHRLDVLTRMTQAILSATSRSRTETIEEFEKVVDFCRSQKSLQFQVYGEEILAKLYDLEGEKILSAKFLKSAKRGRTEGKMFVTPLELQMVNSIS